MHFDAFLKEAVSAVPGSDTGLGCDELFGLYTNWCLLSGREPLPAKALWQALSRRGITPGNNRLAMKGPAAADYIIWNAPSLNAEPPCPRQDQGTEKARPPRNACQCLKASLTFSPVWFPSPLAWVSLTFGPRALIAVSRRQP